MFIEDSIAAIATPPGYGGVGVIRISGDLARFVAEKLTKKTLFPGRFIFSSFNIEDGIQGAIQGAIDQGLVLYFKAPHSFTGQDVVELQTHGSPIVLEMLLEWLVKQGIRLAEPGEFSQRAFLNGKIDLVQAEAIADLIHAQSRAAAKGALESLQGVFSDQVSAWIEHLRRLRVWTEALIDFSEEDIMQDYTQIQKALDQLHQDILLLKKKAQEGVILREGLNMALIGPPNAGKSTLMNALTGKETAIVSPIAGTTRDVVKEDIILGGRHYRILDTAGLRLSSDLIEQEGIRRSYQALERADLVLIIMDLACFLRDYVDQNKALDMPSILASLDIQTEAPLPDCRLILNKIDSLSSDQKEKIQSRLLEQNSAIFFLSLKTGEGLENLHLFLQKFGRTLDNTENTCTVRRRHRQAIEQASVYIHTAMQGFQQCFFDHVAEDLRLAQNVMESITGKTTTEDLLGQIFSSFCIGK